MSAHALQHGIARSSADQDDADASPGQSRSMRTWLSGHARELVLHVERVRQNRDLPRAVFFPNLNWERSASSNFRCYQLALALRSQGWRTVCVPPHLSMSQRMRLLRLERPDVVYLQNARDERNQPKFYTHFAPVIFDLDDADYEVERIRARYEAAARDAWIVTTGSHVLRDWAGRFNSNVHVLWTSHPAPPDTPLIAQVSRAPVLGWAQTRWWMYPRESSTLRDIVRAVHERTPCRFDLFGVEDEAQANEFVAPLRGQGVDCRLVPYLPNDQFIRRLEEVSVGLHVLDSVDRYSSAKSFGKLLSYAAARVAVVATNNFETPRAFTHGLNCLLGETPSQLTDHCVALLQDSAQRVRLSDQAWQLLHDTFEPASNAAKLAAILAPMRSAKPNT